MKRIKIAKNLLLVFVILELIKYFYFGWNIIPMTEAEKFCGHTLNLLFAVSIFLYLHPLFSLYEDAVKNSER